MSGTKLKNIYKNTKIPHEPKVTVPDTQSKMIRHAKKENTTLIGEKFNLSKATRIDRDEGIAGQNYKTDIIIIFHMFKS